VRRINALLGKLQGWNAKRLHHGLLPEIRRALGKKSVYGRWAWIVAEWGDEGDQALVKPTHWMPFSDHFSQPETKAGEG